MNKLSTQPNRATWAELYESCTPQEREEMIGAMLQRIERRRGESIEYFKQMPLALEGLPASRLVDVVDVAMSEAYDWIVKSFPQAREKLGAYETLFLFCMNQGEKSERDLREAIGAICTVWDVSLFPVAVETAPAVAKGKSHRSRSA